MASDNQPADGLQIVQPDSQQLANTISGVSYGADSLQPRAIMCYI